MVFHAVFVFIFPMDIALALIYVKHTELPLCMKCDIEINSP